jgi:hypothetical protein
VPRFGHVGFHRRTANQPQQQLTEVLRHRASGEIVSLALYVTASEARRWRCDGIVGEEANIPKEEAADLGIFTGPDGCLAVTADLSRH